MSRYLLYVILMLCSFLGRGQQSHVTTIVDAVRRMPDDSTKASLLNRLSFLGNDYGLNAKYYNQQALQLSSRLHIQTEKSKALLIRSTFLSARGQSDSALMLLQAAKTPYILKANEYQALFHFCQGMIFLHQGNSKDDVLQNFQTALQFALKTKDDYLISACYGGVSSAYSYLRSFKKEDIEIGQAYVRFAEKQADTLILAKAYQVLGAAYQNAEKYDSAQLYSEKYERLLPHLKAPLFRWLNKHNKAIALTDNGSNILAIAEATAALEIARNELPVERLLQSYYTLSYCYGVYGKFEVSNRYLDTCLKLSDSVNSKEYEMNAVSGLAYNHYHLGNYKSAYDYLDRQLTLTNEISSEKIKVNANFLDIKYQTAKREALLQLQQSQLLQKNTLNYILIGGALVLITIIILLYRNYAHRQKLQQQKIAELETEKQLMATQSLLKGQDDERSRMAKDLHDGLGGMLSGVKLQLGAMQGNLVLTEENGYLFNSALNKLDASISEMRRVAHNMMPEALLKLGLKQPLQDYCNSLNVTDALTIETGFYGLEARMEATTEVTIYRIVQELVNNAIKHSDAQRIHVQVIRQDRSLSITIEDNGKGMDKTVWQNINTSGLQNIRSRVAYLKGNIDIKSESGKGTSVFVECEIEENG